MDSESLKLERRTRAFAVKIIRFVGAFPRGKVEDVLGYQLVKAGTGIGSNYREANRAESRDDFIHKIGIVEKESSETCYWLELCEEANIGDTGERAWLLEESDQLLHLFARINKTAKARRNKSSYVGRLRKQNAEESVGKDI